MSTARTVTATFEITAWDERPSVLASSAGVACSRVEVHKRFTGALVGESVAELLMSEGAGGRAYVASERVEGTLDGRTGSFVLQHGGVHDDRGAPEAFGNIVPGSATGALTGLRGRAEFAHDADGARLTLTCSFS